MSLPEKVRYENFKALTTTNNTNFGKSISIGEAENQFKFPKKGDPGAY